MTSTVILTDFHKLIVRFFDELVSLFPHVREFVMYRIIIKDTIPVIEIMRFLESNIAAERELITQRNDDFFTKNCCLFQLFKDGDSNPFFSDLWCSLDDENKNTIWKWIDALVIFCDRYRRALKTDNTTSI